MALNFPLINPIILPLGPLAISWYSLSYVVGILIGVYYCKYLIDNYSLPISPQQFDDFTSYIIIGIIVGGRLGYVTLYEPARYLANPIEILKTYEGGMSFHGGLVGVVLAALIFSKKNKIPFFILADLTAAAAPITIALARVANFINCELVGRVTDFAFAVKFPPQFIPRHASQLYESCSEGLLNFLLIAVLIKQYRFIEKKMAVSGTFFLVYGLARICCECFRQPDTQIGFIGNYFTMGQILSLPFVIIGIILLCLAKKS
jgi:phosphatidylglycerol:prolipoprotein diacylglycerol transferase